MSMEANTATPKPAAQPSAYSSNYRYAIALVAFFTQIALAMCLGCLSPLGPSIREGLNMNFAQFGLLFTFTNLGTMVMLNITGPLVDKFGVRTVLFVGQALMGALVFLGARTNAVWQLLALQVFVGICNSAAGPTGSKMVVTWFPPKERGAALGLKQAGIPVNSIIAGAVFPLIAAAGGWRLGFNILCVILWVSALLSAFLYRDSDVMKEMSGKNAKQRVTWKEVAKDVFTRDIILLSVGLMFCMGAQYSVSSYMVTYLGRTFTAIGVGEPTIIAGRVLSIASTGGLIGRLIFGAVSDRIFKGRRKSTIIGMNAFALVILLIIAFGADSFSVTMYFILMFLYGITAFAWTGLQLAIASELAGMKAAASAVSFTLSLGFAGMMLSPPIFGAVIDATGGNFWEWILLAAFTLIGIIIIIPVKEKRKEQ